jgi:hypothetical protein
MVLTGEMVKIEYLEIDEIEAKCWIHEHSMVGYMDNSNQTLRLSDIGTTAYVIVKSIDRETGRIELQSLTKN